MALRLRSSPALLVLALVLALGGAAPPAGADDDETIAHLTVFTPEVEVIRAGQAQLKHDRLPLRHGDVVVTGSGRAIVLFLDGTELRLKPRTRVQVSEDERGRDVQLVFGRLWAFVTQRKDRPMNFRAGGTIVAVRGTNLELWYDTATGEFRVGISEGWAVVTMRLPDGSLETVELREDEQVILSTDGTFRREPFAAGQIADPRESEEAAKGFHPDQETKLASIPLCSGCQILDLAQHRCVDVHHLCNDPCFVDQRCTAGVCGGGRRVVSLEHPDCQ